MAEEKKPLQEQNQAGEHHSAEYELVMDLLKKYGKSVGIGVAVIVIVLVVSSAYRINKAQSMERASELLTSAQSIEQFQRVVNNYESTPSAALATLLLAADQLHQGMYDAARMNYQKFLKDHSQHNLVPVAQIGLAYIDEGLGNFDAAKTAFEQFAAAHPDHYLYPTAIFGIARVLEQMGQHAAAKAVYEEFIVENPDSRWIPNAETALLYADKAARAAN